MALRKELKGNIHGTRENVLRLRGEVHEIRELQDAIAQAVAWYSRIVHGPTGVAKRRRPNSDCKNCYAKTVTPASRFCTTKPPASFPSSASIRECSPVFLAREEYSSFSGIKYRTCPCSALRFQTYFYSSLLSLTSGRPKSVCLGILSGTNKTKTLPRKPNRASNPHHVQCHGLPRQPAYSWA